VTIASILAAIRLERASQDEKWGEQNHPSVPLVRDLALVIADASMCRAVCQHAARTGVVTWAHIALEELAEAIDAPDDTARRAELVQLAAVAVAWIESIDRHPARTAAANPTWTGPYAHRVSVDKTTTLCGRRYQRALRCLPACPLCYPLTDSR
jgi:hypothetical protein